MVLVISYDLNGRERPSAYAAVKTASKRDAISTGSLSTRSGLVETNSGPDACVDMLKPVMDANDILLVVQVRRPIKGFLTKSLWDSLNARLGHVA